MQAACAIAGAIAGGIMWLLVALPAFAQDQPEPTEAPVGELSEGVEPESEPNQPEEPVDAPPLLEPDNPPVVPIDTGFGEAPLLKAHHFPDPARHIGRVDRRDELDASADRIILWPTAHTPPRRTLAISNHMLFLSQLSYSPTDDLQLTGSVVVPIYLADPQFAASVKITLSESQNHIVSVQPFAVGREGLGTLGNRAYGGGVAALADLVLSNNVVATLGAVGYLTVVATEIEVLADECPSRADFARGLCDERTQTASLFPPGGHFAGAQVGLTWYITDSWSLRSELMTGVASGSVLGSEWLTEAGGTDNERYFAPSLAPGIPFNTALTLGSGLQWSNGRFAVQMSGYLLRAEFPVRQALGLLPMLNAGMTF